MILKPPAVLVLGWGNLSRGDDALGPLFVAALQQKTPGDLRHRVEFLDDFQLQVEHALDLAGRSRVLLIDASMDGEAPFELRRPKPKRDASYTSHALSPDALLQVCCDMGEQLPRCVAVLAIRGRRFDLGEGVSEDARKHMDAALVWALGWMQCIESGECTLCDAAPSMMCRV